MSDNPVKSDQSNRGRPADPRLQQKRREALLDAANQLLGQKHYQTITIREIAEAAGMKSAMISYYFGGKNELFLALVERMALDMQQELSGLPKAGEPIRALIKMMLNKHKENSGIFRFIADETLGNGMQNEQKLMELMPQKMALFLPGLIRREQTRGVLNPDLDSHWVAFSLVSLIVMPVIGENVRNKVWKIGNETIASPAWADHVYHLFLNGCGVKREH